MKPGTGKKKKTVSLIAEIHPRGFHFDQHLFPQRGTSKVTKCSVSRCPRSRDSSRNGVSGSTRC